MLDRVNPFGASVRPYLSPRIRAQIAEERWQIDAYYRLRREIFAREQGLFEGSDRDAEDARAIPIVALSEVAGMLDEVVGVVRIYEAEENIWFGGRLGVCRAYRARGAVGTSLIDHAVRTARARGASHFYATVQPRNVAYFERRCFRSIGGLEVCGRRHALMEADLSAFGSRNAPALKGAA